MEPQMESSEPTVVVGYVQKDSRGKLYVVIPREFESAMPEKTAVKIVKIE